MPPLFDEEGIARIPLSEAHFLPWLERHMDQRMVPPADAKPTSGTIAGAPIGKMETDDLLALRATLLKYSEDQPRDDHGRWTTDGGSSDGRPWATTRDSREVHKPGGAWVGKDYVGGTYTPDRSALHDRIVGGILSSGTPSALPVVTMLGGGPASGKSSLLASGQLPITPGTVTVNPDDIKAALPEFRPMIAEGGDTAAHASSYVHEESSEVSKMALREASAGHMNVVYDATGDNSLASIETKVDAFRASGAIVNADYVTCDTDTAWARANARASDPSGDRRAVPEDYLRETHASLSATVPQAIDARVWDNFRLWDTNGPRGEAPTLIASYANKGDFTVHDQGLWERFLAKAR